MKLDYSKFANSESLKKMFDDGIQTLEKSNLLVPTEIPNIFNLLLGFDELFSKLKERKEFFNKTFKRVKDNRISFYIEKENYLKSVSFENETLEYKKNIELFECKLKIKNLELSKNFKTFDLNEDGEIINVENFNIIKIVKEMQNIISQNCFSPQTRIRLQNIVTTPTSTETLKDVIFGMLKNESENSKHTNMKKN